MARIYEHQGKELLAKAGVRIPEGKVVFTAEESMEVTERINKAVVIKAQVLATGRFKVGGIKFAETPKDAFDEASKVFSTKIKGIPVRKVLIEEKLEIVHEYYAGIIIDSAANIKAPVLIFSTEGGTEIEEVASRNPERVKKLVINPIDGLRQEDIRVLLTEMNIESERRDEMVRAIYGLYMVFHNYDARSAEMNPFVWTKDDKIYTVDCHIAVDDSSVFRHPELGITVPRDMEREPTELEKLAWLHIEDNDYRGVGYFAQMVTDYEKEEAYIGFHGIGGGASMLGAAALISRGLKIANYADTSGDPPGGKIYKVIKAIFSQPISAYILTGACLANQEQWYHAFALVKALTEELKDRPGFPVLILIAGNKETETIQIIKDGLKSLDIRLEIYGRDYIYKTDVISARAKELLSDYLADKRRRLTNGRRTN
jgi:succinyl-CoA synthetase beta subunit